MSGSWSTKSSKTVYKNNWISVREDEIARPNGSQGIYGVVETNGGVGVVAVGSDGHFSFVAQYRYATNTYSLEIPKGGRDGELGFEAPLEAAKRELREETGLQAGKWTPLATVHTLMGYSNDEVHLFRADDLQKGQKSLDEDEDLIDLRLSPEQALKAMGTGIDLDGIVYKLTDATSICAILLALQADGVT